MKRSIILAAALVFISLFRISAQEPDSAKTYRLDSSYVSDRLPIFRKPNHYLYTPERAAAIVSVIGEPDVVRQTATLPGVSAGVESSLGLFVRGGNSGGSRVEYDGVPVYGTSHLIGLFSSFSPDMVSLTDFRTGGFSSSSGDATSSLMQIRPKSGKLYGTAGNVSLSPYMTSAYLESPLGGKREASFRLAGRFSPLPLIARAITRRSEDAADINGLMHDWVSSFETPAGHGGVLRITGMFTQDRLSVGYDDTDALMQNMSGMGKAEFSSRISDRTDLDIYGYCTFSDVVQKQEYNRTKANSSSFSISSLWVESGLKAMISHSFPEHWAVSGGAELKTFMKAVSGAVFSDVSFRSGRWDILAGYRQNIYSYEGWTQTGADVHIRADFTLTDHIGLEATADRASQYAHVLEGLPTGWALNLMSPATRDFRPETYGQLYAGLFFHKAADVPLLGTASFHFNVGGYFRKMKGLVSYKSSLNMFRLKEDTWDDEVESGKGSAEGIEVSGSMSSARLSANIAYTLSSTERQFPTINGGQPFPFKFDRPHILNFQTDWMTRKRQRAEQHLGCVVSWSSGNLMTVQTSQYPGVRPPYWSTNLRDSYTDRLQDNIYDRMEMSGVNGYRLKDYLRIDIAYSFKFRRPGSTHEVVLSVFNVTNRHNPYLVYNDDGTWMQLSIVPIMPSLRWSVSF